MIPNTSSQDRVIPKRKGLGRRAWIAIVAGVLVIVGGVIYYPIYSRWSSADLSFDLSRLNQATISRGTLVRDLGVEGRIVASSYPTLYAPAEGTITLMVKAGNPVTKDQVLAIIDSPEMDNLLRQEQSRVESLASEHSRQVITTKTTKLQNEQDIDLRKLQFESAKRALNRASITFKDGLIGAAEHEAAEDQVKITELEYHHTVEQARLNLEINEFEVQNRKLELQRQKLVLEEVQRQVDELTIKSPVDGVVGTVNVDPKDVVSANQSLLTVIDLSAYEIQISIPESYGDEIAVGIEAEITYENQQYAGMVAAVAPEVNNSLVTGSVVFTGNLPKGLKQNQRVSTRIILSSKQDVLKVRRGPFLESGGGRKAYVVKDGLAVVRPIRIGSTSLTEVEIVSGLEEGESIIISDTSRFQDAKTILLRN